ncbi:MAG: hypothetical protein KA444_00570 [Bacteroidia bacterium]|nr:hypothetical protein [Bacteroidia bacterium]
MKTLKNQIPGLRTSLVLTLQRDSQLRNYYLYAKSQDEHLILVEEYTSDSNPDHYTVFNSWDEAFQDLNKFETAITAGKRWWSYCPGWMYFNPSFIHHSLKRILEKFISKSLNEIVESDVVPAEKERFNVWLDFCNLSFEKWFSGAHNSRLVTSGNEVFH